MKGAAATMMMMATLIAACAQRPSVPSPQSSVLRVCADPNNLPFSNANGEGFENKIATLVARDFNAHVDYTWLPQRMGFVRNTLKRGDCDVIIGVPSNYEQTAATAPYYRSSYVFVTRKGRAVRSLDDPRLRGMRIGVEVQSPPVFALASRHLIDNIRGYPILDHGARTLVGAVARGDVDVAIVWGPPAGWFARQQRAALELTPVSPQIDPPFLPFVFDISMGVRRGDTALRERLDAEIDRRRPDIERILDAYGVPRV
jgi:mxaJ protein